MSAGDDRKVCSTERCKAAARFIKSNMNLSANPCEDFFHYVCGGWLQKEKKTDEPGRDGILQELIVEVREEVTKLLISSKKNRSQAVNQAKIFYQACIKMDISKELEGLKRIVTDIGGFPFYKKATYNKNVSWVQRLARVMREFTPIDYNFFKFKWGVLFMVQIINYEILVTTVPKNWFPTPQAALDEEQKKNIYDFLCGNLTSCTPEEGRIVRKQIAEMREFMGKLYELNNESYARDQTLSLKEFESRFPKVQMQAFLKELFKNSKVKITESMTITFPEDRYFQTLTKLISSTKQEGLVIDNVIGYYFLFNFPIQHLLHRPKVIVIKNWCYHKVVTHLPMAVSRLFVDKFYDVETKNIIVEKAEHLRQAFIGIIKENKFYHEDVKKEAIRKMMHLDIHIAFPSWIKYDFMLDNVYALKMYWRNETVIENTRRFFASSTRDYLHSMINYQKTLWSNFAPHVVNAEMHSTQVSVVFALAQYHSYFYWPKTVKALEYSSAVVTLAHEIGHTLDSTGIHFDAKGNETHWYKPSESEFNKRYHCFIEQYGNMTEPTTNMHLNGLLIVKEHIADVIGIRLAIEAYLRNGPVDERLFGLENINDKQLLFIAGVMGRCAKLDAENIRALIPSAIHPLDFYRAYIPLSNLERFSEVFHCKKGSVMNPKVKCQWW